MAADPAGWLAAGGHVLAHGRDPNFPPWGDVVQLNAFAPALRAAAADTLASIAGQCDGIRCDMAMLLTSQVFARTWGGHAGPAPGQEFWPEVLGTLRGKHPDTVFIAEAYWDMEWLLQQQGFDFCYDKRLYDRLVGADAPGRPRASAGRAGLPVPAAALPGEPRRAADRQPAAHGRGSGPRRWPWPRCPARRCGTRGSSRAAGCGRRCSWPGGPASRSTPGWPAGTGACWRRWPAARCGRAAGGCSTWPGWPDNQSCRNLIGWAWDGAPGGDRHLVVVNLSGQPAQGRLPLGWPDLPGRRWELASLLGAEVYQRDGGELAHPGLFVNLGPWQFHLLAVR